MTPTLHQAAQLISFGYSSPQAWRNGSGQTRELLTWPSADDWQLRISVADIRADGPFSSFEGVQRWFAVVQGEGVLLHIDDQIHRQTTLEAPLHFAGDAQTSCELINGPTRDLNLMLRQLDGAMHLTGSDRWQPRKAQCGLFAAGPGSCEADGQSWPVPEMTLLWFDTAPQALRFERLGPTQAPAWWIEAGQ
jgi:hypothetical protein